MGDGAYAKAGASAQSLVDTAQMRRASAAAFLTSRGADRPPVNVHVFAANDSLLDDNRAIRDYLQRTLTSRASTSACQENALEKGHRDLLSSSHANGERVAAIREAACRWAQ